VNTIEDLARAWIAVKATELAAANERVDIETSIIEQLGAKEEGSQTHDLECGLKVTVTGKLTYKADVPELLALAERLPEHLRPIKTETRLDEAGAKYLRANEPELWRLIAPAIEIKPAKTALTVKEP
jgi:hypothetical protein